MESENESGDEGDISSPSSRRMRTRVAAGSSQVKTSRGSKRKSEVNVESLYLQENFTVPPNTPLETIFESPKPVKKKGLQSIVEENRDQFDGRELEGLTLMTTRKLKRLCTFSSHYCPPKLKVKQRKDRARRLKQLTGVCVPKGSRISEEDVMMALACLSESDDNPKNDQNTRNRSFSSSLSSEFYSGNVICPDTSAMAMDYVINTMSELSVANSDSQTGSVGKEMIPPELVENLLPFDDEPTEQKVISREKKLRRRSGRMSVIDKLPSIPKEVDTHTEENLNNLLPFDDERKLIPMDRKMKRRSGRVVALPTESRELIPLLEDLPVVTDTTISPEGNISAIGNAPPFLTVPETTSESIAEVSVLNPQETGINIHADAVESIAEVSASNPEESGINIHADTVESTTEVSVSDPAEASTNAPTDADVKPVKRRATVRNRKAVNEDSSLSDIPRLQAKKRTRQRKPTLDTSAIEKKSQKLDMGLKRGSNIKVINLLCKKMKTSSKSPIEDEAPEGSDSLVPELNPMPGLEPPLVMPVEAGFSLMVDTGRDEVLGKVGHETGGKAGSGTKRKSRSKRRVSGIQRSLYRKSVTEEEVIESSPEMFRDKQSDTQGAGLGTPLWPDVSQFCSNNKIPPEDGFICHSNLSLTSEPPLKTSFPECFATGVQQMSENTGTLSTLSFGNLPCAKFVLPVTETEGNVTRSQTSGNLVMGSNNPTESSEYLYAASTPSSLPTSHCTLSPSLTTALTVSISCASSVSSSTSLSSSSMMEDSAAVYSPTSASTRLAALSLHSDIRTSPTNNTSGLPPTSSRPPSAQVLKKKSRRRSARLSLDRIRMDIGKSDNSNLGSFWAEGSPLCIGKSSGGIKTPSSVSTAPTTSTTGTSVNLPMSGIMEPVSSVIEPVLCITEPVSSAPELDSGAPDPIPNVTQPVSDATKPVSSFTEPISSVLELEKQPDTVVTKKEKKPGLRRMSATGTISNCTEPLSSVSEQQKLLKEEPDTVETEKEKKPGVRKARQVKRSTERKARGTSQGKRVRVRLKGRATLKEGDEPQNESQPSSTCRNDVGLKAVGAASGVEEEESSAPQGTDNPLLSGLTDRKQETETQFENFSCTASHSGVLHNTREIVDSFLKVEYLDRAALKMLPRPNQSIDSCVNLQNDVESVSEYVSAAAEPALTVSSIEVQ